MEKKCKCCGSIFKTYKKKQVYCSRVCGQSEKKQNKITKTCEYSGCTKTFDVLLNSKQKFCCIECQRLWQKNYQKGENNGNYGRENKWGHHSDEVKKNISKKITETWLKDERVKKHNEARERFKLINGYYPNNSPLAREKISEANVNRINESNHLTTYKNCKRGYYRNLKNNDNLEYFHSSWEEILMKKLDVDDGVLTWTKKHGIIIKYKHDGVNKSYIPDFLIEYKDGKKVIEEVKGYIDDVEVFKLKKEACERYCNENRFEYKVNFMKNYEKYKHLL